MNLTDLKQVLDERSGDSTEHIMHNMRLSGVRAKVRARRRRRLAAWASCAVLALAGVTATAVVPGLRTDAGPAPATSPSPPRTIEGFPEYASGARVLAARSAALPQLSIELTIVPTTDDMVVFKRCDHPGRGIELQEKLTVNGRDFSSGACGGKHAFRPSSWLSLGVVVGRPATFVMTITGAKHSGQNIDAPVPQTGTFALAIGERVPFDEYPLPPRPAGTLGSLNETLPAGCTEALCPDAVIIRSDPADPTRTVRRTVTWRTASSIDMVSQTPGFLHLRVNGVKITTGEWWDYDMSPYAMYGDQGGAWKAGFRLDLQPGDPVTIEIVPEHMTGAWQVVLSPGEAGEGE